MQSNTDKNHLPAKRKSNNKNGHNQWTQKDFIEPYTIRYARAKVYLDQGKTLKEINQLTGLSNTTLVNIRHGRIKPEKYLVEQLKKGESAKISLIAHTILDSINQDDYDKASLLQKTTAFSQLVDKRRLLDGQSTSNESINVVGNIQSYLEKSDQELQELKDRLKKTDNE